MRPDTPLKPWRKTLRAESRGVPTGRRPRQILTQSPKERPHAT